MSKRLFYIALGFFILNSQISFAQQIKDLFRLPDTVCTSHEIAPFDIVQNRQNYQWTLCPPDLKAKPEGQSDGEQLQGVGQVRNAVLVEENGVHYSFHINHVGDLVRMRYVEGVKGPQSFITHVGNLGSVANGLSVLKENGVWYAFVIGGNTVANTKLIRYEFGEGVMLPPTEVIDFGNFGDSLFIPKQLSFIQDQGVWYAFTFTNTDELIRFKFGSSIRNHPTLENLSNIDGHFSGASGIACINELGDWHMFVTNRLSHNVTRVSFGNSLSNTPFVINLGNFSNAIRYPVGINITKACNSYYAYVMSQGNASLITLLWDEKSVASIPEAINHGNVAQFYVPQTLSNLTSDSNTLAMFVYNYDSTLSRIFFNSCDDQIDVERIDDRSIPTFKINSPGLYTVKLTVDEGLPTVESTCQQVYVYAHNPLTYSNDTMICQGDTIELEVLAFGVDTFRWSPNYNISHEVGQFIRVWPEYSLGYTFTSYFDYNCIVRKTIQVDVSKILADAGTDRTISDGARTQLGGPATTLGDDYTYQWTPDIGFEGPNYLPFTDVRPPYNMTYYLEITNTFGCYDIDTVRVVVLCDKINLPNAFTPNSPNKKVSSFGVENLQFEKINYFRIYDRWGKLLFETNDKFNTWDGTFEGNEVPLGVYVWEIDAACANGDRLRKTGTVTLIR